MIDTRNVRDGFWALPAATPHELRRFGLVVSVPLLLLAGLLLYRGNTVGAAWLAASSVAAVLIAISFPLALRPVYVPWMYLARVLGWVNTHLLLGVVFYTLFTAVGLAMRLVGHDPLHRRPDRSRESYWGHRDQPLAPSEHFRRQF